MKRGYDILNTVMYFYFSVFIRDVFIYFVRQLTCFITAWLVITSIWKKVNVADDLMTSNKSASCVNNVNVFGISCIQANCRVHVAKKGRRWI